MGRGRIQIPAHWPVIGPSGDLEWSEDLGARGSGFGFRCNKGEIKRMLSLVYLS